MASQSIFDLAARACGHDPDTGVGAENARHDRRVWDLAEQHQAEVNTQAWALLDTVDFGEVSS